MARQEEDIKDKLLSLSFQPKLSEVLDAKKNRFKPGSEHEIHTNFDLDKNPKVKRDIMFNVDKLSRSFTIFCLLGNLNIFQTMAGQRPIFVIEM